MKKKAITLYYLVALLPLLLLTVYSYSKEHTENTQKIDSPTDQSIFEYIYFSSRDEYMQKIKLYKPEDAETYHAYIPTNPDDELRIYFSQCSAVVIDGIELSNGDLLPTLIPETPYDVQVFDTNNKVIGTDRITFYYSGTLPAIYINTSSGNMDQINENKWLAENASFAIYTPDGKIDSLGQCTIKGRGNSSWKVNPKPYNLNLTFSSSLLGMDRCSDWALLNNFGDDYPQLKNKIAFELSHKLGQPFAPQCEFVNVYLNGIYNGFYLLTQRINVTDGTVKIDDLESTTIFSNQNNDSLETFNITTSDGLIEHGVAGINNTTDITGGYLLEFDARYEQETSYFTTKHHKTVIKSPQKANQEQVAYIANQVREAEAAIYSETGINTITGQSYLEYIDLDSWSKMYILQDYLAQYDLEYASFYFYKQKGNPLLYAGPIWDCDQSCGKMYYGYYPQLACQTIWAGEVQGKWLKNLYKHPAFAEYVAVQYLTELSPAISELLETEYTDIVTPLISASKMSAMRFNKNDILHNEATSLYHWLTKRQAFLDDYYQHPEQYYQVIFHFEWTDVPYYVKKNTPLSFLPCDEYGEYDWRGDIHFGYQDILGWTDELGNEVSAEDIITENRDYYPIYQLLKEQTTD